MGMQYPADLPRGTDHSDYLDRVPRAAAACAELAPPQRVVFSLFSVFLPVACHVTERSKVCAGPFPSRMRRSRNPLMWHQLSG